MMNSAEPTTFLAGLTPPGNAALATLALVGPRAWIMVQELFRPAGSRRLPTQPEPGRFWFGKLGEDSTNDEVVLAIKTISPVFHLELHCHGGSEVIRFLGELFTIRGAKICSWQEMFRHSGMPRWRIEAEEALSQAPTVRTSAILLDQYHGAFIQAVRRLGASLQAGQVTDAKRMLNELIHRVPLGRHLLEPWHVVIAGAPNVGKSSLVNALAGYTRSVVSPQPGTTRDIVTTRLALDGWPVAITDTAGLRHTSEGLEKAGIDRARAALDRADLILWVLDASTTPVFPEDIGKQMITVINKVDLVPAWDFSQVPRALRVSALGGEGMAELCQALARTLVPDPPGPDAPVPFTSRHGKLLEKIRTCLATGKSQEGLELLRELSEF